MLSACQDPPPPADITDRYGLPVRWPGAQPPTWQEWRAQQGRLRGDDWSWEAYRPSFLPDMSRWQASDFLPEAYLRLPFRDACELPEEERRALFDLKPEEPDQLRRLIDYAERGYVQAMMGLSSTFCSFPPKQPALTRKDGLEWARKAAASGDPYAMFTLGACMREIWVDRAHDEIGLEAKDIQRVSFWFDELVYWHWRAAQYLEPFAMYEMAPVLGSFYFPGDYADGFDKREWAIENYKWLRLLWISDLFHKVPFSRDPLEEARKKWPEMTDGDVAEAERRAAEFLRRFGGGLRYARQDYRCPGELDFAALNAQLARYGLKVDPLQPWTPPSYPLAPLTEPAR